MVTQGCGVIFYNRRKGAVLLFRRDNKPSISFPDMLDMLGGNVEVGEVPRLALEREMAEELLDLRTNKPYVLEGHEHFLTYTDIRGCEQHIYALGVDFEIEDLQLLEGQELAWVTEDDLGSGMKLAYEFEEVLQAFYLQLKMK